MRSKTFATNFIKNTAFQENEILLFTVQRIEFATKWLRIMSLGGNDKIRNHIVVNPIHPFPLDANFRSLVQPTERRARGPLLKLYFTNSRHVLPNCFYIVKTLPFQRHLRLRKQAEISTSQIRRVVEWLVNHDDRFSSKKLPGNHREVCCSIAMQERRFSWLVHVPPDPTNSSQKTIK